MKAIIIAVIAVVVMVIGLQLTSKPMEFVNTRTTVEVVPEEVKEAWMTNEKAIQAAKDVIRQEELQAELESLQMVQASTTARIKEVQKELSTF